jgi:N-acetylglutamate synthase-like GNAT family acetyltransferase
MMESIIKDVVVTNLADEPEFIEQVSVWLWEEWSKANGNPLETTIYRTKHSICKGKIPQMLIAKYKDELVGTVSLWHNDLTSRQDLTPWLATLYIKTEYRGKGIGTLLQEKCIEAARELGYKELYLITDHENYYERSGWKFLEMAPNKDTFIRVYEYEIN